MFLDESRANGLLASKVQDEDGTKYRTRKRAFYPQSINDMFAIDTHVGVQENVLIVWQFAQLDYILTRGSCSYFG